MWRNPESPTELREQDERPAPGTDPVAEGAGISPAEEPGSESSPSPMPKHCVTSSPSGRPPSACVGSDPAPAPAPAPAPMMRAAADSPEKQIDRGN